MHYVKEKSTGTLVAADTAIQAEMLCLQGHRPLTGDERAELKRLDTATAAPANTEIDHTPADGASSAGAPPKTGPGSGRGSWHEYAAAHGVAVEESASRDEIIAACEKAGVATE